MRLSGGFGIAVAAGFALCEAAFAQSEPAIHQAIIDGNAQAIWDNLDQANEPGVSPEGIRPLMRLLTPEAASVLDDSVRVDLITRLYDEGGADLRYEGYEDFEAAFYTYGPPLSVELDLSEQSSDLREAILSGDYNWRIPFHRVSDFFEPYWGGHTEIHCSPLGLIMLGALISEPGSNSFFEANEKLVAYGDYLGASVTDLNQVCQFSGVPFGINIRDGKVSIYDWLIFAGLAHGNEAGLAQTIEWMDFHFLADHGGFDEAQYEQALERFAGYFERRGETPPDVSGTIYDQSTNTQLRPSNSSAANTQTANSGVEMASSNTASTSRASLNSQNQSVVNEMRVMVDSRNRATLSEPWGGTDGEPDLHQAILRGDLNAFRRAMDDPHQPSRFPRNMTPFIRILSVEAQNAAPRDTRLTMLRELMAVRGHQFQNSDGRWETDFATSSHIMSFAPPEFVREQLLEYREASGLSTDYLSTYYPLVVDVSGNPDDRISFFAFSPSVSCSPIGAVVAGLAFSDSGTNGRLESLHNFISLFEILPAELIETETACRFSGSKLDTLAGQELGIIEFLLFMTAAYDSEDVLDEALTILSRLGNFTSSDIENAASRVRPMMAQIQETRDLEEARAALQADLRSAWIDPSEPAIHRALLQGNVAEVRANLSQVWTPSANPPGMLPLFRLYTPEVQNVLNEGEQLDLRNLIMDAMGDGVSDLNGNLDLSMVAAYGDAREFWVRLQVARFRGELQLPGSFEMRVPSYLLGQDNFREFGATEHTCPVIMHVYYSLRDAPYGSRQLEQAQIKMNMLLRGTQFEIDGVDRNSPYRTHPGATCRFVEMPAGALHRTSDGVYYIDHPSIFTELGRDLNNPARAERAQWVITQLQEYGLYSDAAMQRAAEDASRMEQNVANRRQEWAQRSADRRAAERADQQRRNQQQEQDWSAALAQGLALFSQGTQTQSGYGASGSVSGYGSTGYNSGGSGSDGQLILQTDRFARQPDAEYQDNSSGYTGIQTDGELNHEFRSWVLCPGVRQEDYVGRTLPACNRAGEMVEQSRPLSSTPGGAIQN
ncbi:hypothetical protein [Ponticaulis sp.]|uniref:hypothetical protein n=1 Tax=Ponticaulis sp. TaxID=2020902 RepID=UPI000B6B7A53|nr:hypothetical protein [Ponticaulis sp.]MAI89666.1 hypothetical protein [Ponticaulis sp.]OUY00686.1 MAG: hypothetical protein CBB65_04445 [Hyphomonadaceae bacterium TMED5]|tara:strand:+ start:123382 stop:126555 length:3174 start_codon:yes stop_codon:yes gene_type:complete